MLLSVMQNQKRIVTIKRAPGDTSRELNDSDEALAAIAVRADTAVEIGYYDLILVDGGLDLDTDIKIK